MSSDPMVKALLRLCGDPADKSTIARRKEVAERLGASEQTLYQILKGVPLASGKPRGVGRALRQKLDAEFPGWLTEADVAETVEAKPLGDDLTKALRTIRNHLVHSHGDRSAQVAEALRLLALMPDSDRAFNNALGALGALSGTPYQVAAVTAVATAFTEPGRVIIGRKGTGKTAYTREFLERVARGNNNPSELHLLMEYLEKADEQAAADEAQSVKITATDR